MINLNNRNLFEVADNNMYYSGWQMEIKLIEDVSTQLFDNNFLMATISRY